MIIDCVSVIFGRFLWKLTASVKVKCFKRDETDGEKGRQLTTESKIEGGANPQTECMSEVIYVHKKKPKSEVKPTEHGEKLKDNQPTKTETNTTPETQLIVMSTNCLGFIPMRFSEILKRETKRTRYESGAGEGHKFAIETGQEVNYQNTYMSEFGLGNKQTQETKPAKSKERQQDNQLFKTRENPMPNVEPVNVREEVGQIANLKTKDAEPYTSKNPDDDEPWFPNVSI